MSTATNCFYYGDLLFWILQFISAAILKFFNKLFFTVSELAVLKYVQSFCVKSSVSTTFLMILFIFCML